MAWAGFDPEETFGVRPTPPTHAVGVAVSGFRYWPPGCAGQPSARTAPSGDCSVSVM